MIALAYRLLGTVEEAEDAVQETYLRWYRLSDDERAAIDNPSGWVSRVTSRVCLDVQVGAQPPGEVRRALAARADPPGFPRRPEDPADRATLDDTVSTALLVVLDAMTLADRVAFVLHDVWIVLNPDKLARWS